MVTNRNGGPEGEQPARFRRSPHPAPRAYHAVDGEQRPARVLTTNVGLQIPAGLAFEEWERAGRRLSGLVNSSSWWLGDWLVYGKDHYSDRYERGIRAAGLQYQTLRNYAWVSRRFDVVRRRAGLSFQHHAELAPLPVEEQDAWLDRAEQLGWTTKQLRGAIRLAREDAADTGREPAAETERPAEPTRRLAVPDSRLQWWHRAAEQTGTDFEQWVLATLDNAAEQVLEEARA
ncbi:LmbU family transcriptional regulator [Streptomyces sp. NPDC020875]|uniref:LmbU family transcriptional regulator n=1 Tax=Streptomyces sp. NPDC020875 TaxID=3154898 RepID=UPI0033E7BFC2